MPCRSLIGWPCLVRVSGTIWSFSWPSADQSRCASSRSLSDFEIQSARRRPCSQLSSSNASRLPALAAARAVAKKIALAELHRAFGLWRDTVQPVEVVVGLVMARQKSLMGFARIDDRLDLRVGQDSIRDQMARQSRHIGWHRRSDGGHGRRLHKRGRMRLGVVDGNGLQAIGLIELVAGMRRLLHGGFALIGDGLAAGAFRRERRSRESGQTPVSRRALAPRTF